MERWAWVVKFLPRNLLSRCTGWLVSLKLPTALRLWSLQKFAAAYSIRLDEAEKPLQDYSCIGDFFTRRLKPGIRPLASAWGVHPADSAISVVEQIADDSFVQAKGLKYSIQEILALSNNQNPFVGGFQLTYYLCPTDYHRVHSPCEGFIDEVVWIPGTLWPVNEWSVANVPKLFAVNERVVVWIQTVKGRIAVVLVGATNVGKMSLAFDSSIITNQVTVRSIQRKTYSEPLQIQKGDELGCFHMGSTVLLLIPKQALNSAATTQLFKFRGQKVQMGQELLQ